MNDSLRKFDNFILRRRPLQKWVDDLEALRSSPAEYLAGREVRIPPISAGFVVYPLAGAIILSAGILLARGEKLSLEIISGSLYSVLMILGAAYFDRRNLRLTAEGVEQHHWGTALILPWEIFSPSGDMERQFYATWLPIKREQIERIERRRGGVVVESGKEMALPGMEDGRILMSPGYRVDPVELGSLVLELSAVLASEKMGKFEAVPPPHGPKGPC